jgi:hypothetical protein
MCGQMNRDDYNEYEEQIYMINIRRDGNIDTLNLWLGAQRYAMNMRRLIDTDR